ncbi:hypothetical protein P3L10_001454 [Capsicum annuum]
MRNSLVFLSAGIITLAVRLIQHTAQESITSHSCLYQQNKQSWSFGNKSTIWLEETRVFVTMPLKCWFISFSFCHVKPFPL